MDCGLFHGPPGIHPGGEEITLILALVDHQAVVSMGQLASSLFPRTVRVHLMEYAHRCQRTSRPKSQEAKLLGGKLARARRSRRDVHVGRQDPITSGGGRVK